jgi:hypothetical protein
MAAVGVVNFVNEFVCFLEQAQSHLELFSVFVRFAILRHILQES